MTLNICEYCNKEYATEKILKTHQKTAKFCIGIQKGLNIQASPDTREIRIFRCDYCNDEFSMKHHLERHYETCKTRSIKIKEENDKKKDELILKLKEEILNIKTELRVKDEQLSSSTLLVKMKDEINQELKKEIESLRNKVDKSYNTIIERTDKTYDSFFQKEEKLVDTLIHQNNSIISSLPHNKNTKSVNNSLTINNFGIKPITAESVINAFESYNTKQKDAFNAFQYDCITLERGSMKVEYIFYGIIKELKDYYGITDISREKVVFNNNGEMTLTTVQEFIRTNVVMNNIDYILEWISNLLSQINQRIQDGEIEINGKMREMSDVEKNKLTDTGESLEYIYKLFKISKDKGTANTYMTKWLSDGAIKEGKVISKPMLLNNK